MKVTLLGCGALGSVFAMLLHRYGECALQVFQRPGDHFEALSSGGLNVQHPHEGKMNVPLRVSTRASYLEPADLVIVTVKSYDTETAAGAALELLEKDGIVLTLQNGLGNAEVLSAVLGPQRVAAGVTTFGGYRKAPGSVVWGGEGKVVFGPWSGGVDIEQVRTLFEKSRMNPVLLDDPRPAIWGKIVINAAVNPAAALSRLCNGALIANDQSRELMKNVALEAVRAAGISGVDIDPEASWRNLVETLQRTAANRPSMLQDVEAGRKTEIEAILAPILKAGETAGETFPFTRALYSLLRAVEQERLAARGGSDA